MRLAHQNKVAGLKSLLCIGLLTGLNTAHAYTPVSNRRTIVAYQDASIVEARKIQDGTGSLSYYLSLCEWLKTNSGGYCERYSTHNLVLRKRK